MTYIRSFAKTERKLMHHYRDQINHAESEEDIKKFFSQTIQQLLNEVLDGELHIEDGDVVLDPNNAPYFSVSERLGGEQAYREVRDHSDLSAILRRFAEPAVKHYRHLSGHPEKTEAKIRHHS